MNNEENYEPPFAITPEILSLVAEISGRVGGLEALRSEVTVPQLRRGNRVKVIQASLAIEGNTLTLDQVTAVLEGKRILGAPREIQEVKNAFAVYEKIVDFIPSSLDDLLEGHRLMMQTLIDEAGQFRSGAVGITRGDQLVHMAPPVHLVPDQIRQLLAWLEQTKLHPLVASSIFHYEFEFIHPFTDGNGRMGRFWQTLTLSKWHGIFSLLPVESVIRDRQNDYYKALSQADSQGQSTYFVEFMLKAILEALKEVDTEQESVQETEQVEKLLSVLGTIPLSGKDLMELVGLSHRPTFLYSYLHPALEAGYIEMTNPESPRARNQKYRLTAKGKKVQKQFGVINGQ